MKKIALLVALLLPIYSQAFAAVRLDNESSTVGYINAIDCVGSGIDCTKSGITGTLTVNGGGAPTDATYLTQTANSTLSAEQALSSLESGIMRVNSGDGVVTSLVDSAGIAANVSDETGSGLLVFATSPSIVTPAVSGTPAVAGALGYNTTQKMQTTYGGATTVVAPIHGTIAAGIGTETHTNDAATDKDFASAYTFPANAIYTNKVYRVTFFVETVTGVSSVTLTNYLKIGSTKVYTSGTVDLANSVTRSVAYSFLIIGKAAAGAAADVSTSVVSMQNFTSTTIPNTVNQPVALATNGTLTINLGITYSGTGSTETIEQQGFLIEELN